MPRAFLILLTVALLSPTSCALRDRDWMPTRRLETPELSLRTALTPEATRRIADLLTRGIAAYRDLHGKTWNLPPAPPRLTVWLFADRNAFEQAGALEAPTLDLEGVTGFYAYGSRILYVGCRRGLSEEGVATVAVHELTHALDHQWARCVPREGPGSISPWLLEGRADYLAYRLIPPGRAQARALRRALSEGDLSSLIDCSPEAFLDKAFGNYAMSRVFTGFLLEGEGGRHAAAFRAFLKGMPGACSRKALESSVGPIRDLEGGFRAYAESLLADQGSP